MPKTLITTNDDKGRHWLNNLCATTYNKAKLDEGRAQCLNENGGDFQERLRELIDEIASPISKRDEMLADEEVSSSATYPREFRGLRPIEEQVETLLGHFPGLDPTAVLRRHAGKYRELKLPKWVEGPLVVPTEEALGRLFFPKVEHPARHYNRAVSLVLEKIAAQREFMNLEEDNLQRNKLRQLLRTTHALEEIGMWQEGDFLILPVQLGMRHRGRSASRSVKLFERTTNEAGLSTLAGCICALVHPERFVRTSELDITMPGDEFPFGDGPYKRHPCLYVGRSAPDLLFGKEGTFDRVNPQFGAATFYFC